MESQLRKRLTGTGSCIQVGKRRLFVVPLSRSQVTREIFNAQLNRLLGKRWKTSNWVHIGF